MNSRSEFARGWPVILASAMGVGVGITGLPFYTFGIFIRPLSAEFGWSRGSIAAGMLFLNLGAVLTGPFVGKLIDRHGVRTPALVSLIGLAFGFCLLSLSGPGIIGFFAGWLLVSFLGCATTPLTWTRAVSLMFDRSRGLALGLTLLGTGLASIFGPPLLQMLIAAHGWRGGYIGMGLFVALVALPIVFFCLRERAPGDTMVGEATSLSGLSYCEAIVTRRFWLIGIGIFFVITAQASATVHLVPLLGDRGMTAAQAAKIAGMLGFSVVIGRVLVGLLLDRFAAPKVARIFLALPAVSMALLLARHDTGPAIAAVILLGLAAGAEVDLLAYLVSRYFGMHSYGAIYGTMLSLFGLGAGLGPVLTGRVYDATGSYDPALVAGIVLFLAGAAATGFLGPYPLFEPLDTLEDAR